MVFTFWYHPAENTQGHLIGFFYMFLLMLQGSLFLTRLHVNRWWMVVQEVTVLFHGALVAVQQMTSDITTGIWPMFFFGFAVIFIVTQLYGLGLKRWQTRIPAVEYLAAVVLALLIGAVVGVARLGRRFARLRTEA